MNDSVDINEIEALLSSDDSSIELLSNKHNIVPESSKGVSLKIHTDGSAKGHVQSSDGRSSAGWGFYIKGVSHARTSEWTRHGGMPCASSLEAELFAVYKAIQTIAFPANAEIHTDNSQVIRYLTNAEKYLQKKSDIENIDPIHRTRKDNLSFAAISILEKIADEIEGNTKILSLDVSWVKAHTLDGIKNLPDPEKIENPDLREKYEARIGNKKADQEASLGIEKGVRNQIWNLRHNFNDRPKYGKSLVRLKQNIQLSGDICKIAKQYLDSKPKFITKQALYTIFPREVAKELSSSWDRQSGFIPKFLASNPDLKKTRSSSYSFN